MKPIKAQFLGACLCLLPLTAVMAQPIQFVISGQISGVSEPAIFQSQTVLTDAQFKVVIDADTQSLLSGYSFAQLPATSATFSIDGLGTAMASAPALAVDFGAGSPVSGLVLSWDNVQSALLWFSGSILQNGAQLLAESSAPSSLNLLTPLTDSRVLTVFPYTTVLHFPTGTAFGISKLSNVTFSASMVPEPGTFATFALASIALVLQVRKRRPG